MLRCEEIVRGNIKYFKQAIWAGWVTYTIPATPPTITNDENNNKAYIENIKFWIFYTLKTLWTPIHIAALMRLLITP